MAFYRQKSNQLRQINIIKRFKPLHQIGRGDSRHACNKRKKEETLKKMTLNTSRSQTTWPYLSKACNIVSKLSFSLNGYIFLRFCYTVLKV